MHFSFLSSSLFCDLSIWSTLRMSRAGTCHPNRSTGTSPVVVAKRQLRGTKLPGADLAYGQFLSCSSMGIAIAMVKRVKPWILYPYGRHGPYCDIGDVRNDHSRPCPNIPHNDVLTFDHGTIDNAQEPM